MKIKKLDHLQEIYDAYDAFLVDLWGVMHNGIRLNLSAINAVKKLEDKGKRIIFLSNAPRPTKEVVEFLKKLNMEEKLLKNVLTSGEVALNFLKKNKFGEKFYHLGPQRDDALFFDRKKNVIAATKMAAATTKPVKAGAASAIIGRLARVLLLSETMFPPSAA